MGYFSASENIFFMFGIKYCLFHVRIIFHDIMFKERKSQWKQKIKIQNPVVSVSLWMS